MAIVQTQAQLRPIAAKVGIPTERSDQIKAAGGAALTTAQLQAIVRSIGYYSERANHLQAAGLTMA